jgi:hypothetical protein
MLHIKAVDFNVNFIQCAILLYKEPFFGGGGGIGEISASCEAGVIFDRKTPK